MSEPAPVRLIASEYTSAFRCPVCNRLFEAPAAPRGSRPWSTEEARVRIDADFRAHLQDCHAVEQDFAVETRKQFSPARASPPYPLPGPILVSAAPVECLPRGRAGSKGLTVFPS